MGSVIAIRGLVDAVRETNRDRRKDAAIYRNLILAAPDYDRVEFDRGPARTLTSAKLPMTIYASTNDKALQISAGAWGGKPRLGEVRSGIYSRAGIDSVDATEVDDGFPWHSYFSTSRPVMNDIYLVIENALPPSKRNLREMTTRDGLYWRFK